MRTTNERCSQRTVGRLFSKSGCLHLVLDVNSDTGFAKVSCRTNGSPEVIEMPISEIIDRLGTGNELKLDGLNSSETEARVVKKDSRWFFQAREGKHGPYPSEKTAKRAMKQHILCAQEEGRTGRSAQL